MNVLNHARHYDRDRFQLSLACGEEGEFTEEMRELGVDVHIVPLPELRRVGTVKVLSNLTSGIFGLAKLMRRIGIDVVHCNTVRASIYGLPAATLAGIPRLWHLQDIVDPFGPVQLVLQALATRTIVISHAVGHFFTGRRARRAILIPNGVDLDEFQPDAQDQGIRFDWGVRPDETVIGLVGRLASWKGQHLLVHAASRLMKAGYSVRLVFAGDTRFGDPAYLDELRQLIRDVGLENQVVFTGFIRDVSKVMASLDIVVVPSFHEPFGRVVIEGMAARKPVVGSAGGGIPNIIDDGVDGLLFPVGSVDDLTRQLSKLCANPSLRATLGQAARQRVEKEFSIGTYVQRLESLYEHVSQSR